MNSLTKQKCYAYANLQIVLNNVENVSLRKKKRQPFDFWPHDFDIAPLPGVMNKPAETVDSIFCIQSWDIDGREQ